MEELPFPENRTRGSRPLEMRHTETMGPIKPALFPSGNRLIIVFVDDSTRFTKAYSVKHKNEAAKKPVISESITEQNSQVGNSQK